MPIKPVGENITKREERQMGGGGGERGRGIEPLRVIQSRVTARK